MGHLIIYSVIYLFITGTDDKAMVRRFAGNSSKTILLKIWNKKLQFCNFFFRHSYTFATREKLLSAPFAELWTESLLSVTSTLAGLSPFFSCERGSNPWNLIKALSSAHISLGRGFHRASISNTALLSVFSVFLFFFNFLFSYFPSARLFSVITDRLFTTTRACRQRPLRPAPDRNWLL